MNKEIEIQHLTNEIQKLLRELSRTFFDVFVMPSYYGDEPEEKNPYWEYLERDNQTWLFHGTRELYLKICLFLELKNLPLYHKMFVEKFSTIVENETKVLESYGGLYNDSEPTMIILDNISEFLSAFHEFDGDKLKKQENNKLKLILENTTPILARTNTKITNEASIYSPVKWFVEVVYPLTRNLGKARFIEKFSTYHPDILVPELSSAVEYKYIRKGENPEKFLTQIKTDADNYKDDPEYRFFYAVVVYQDKSELNQEAFKRAVIEKSFPENWIIFAL